MQDLVRSHLYLNISRCIRHILLYPFISCYILPSAPGERAAAARAAARPSIAPDDATGLESATRACPNRVWVGSLAPRIVLPLQWTAWPASAHEVVPGRSDALVANQERPGCGWGNTDGQDGAVSSHVRGNLKSQGYMAKIFSVAAAPSPSIVSYCISIYLAGISHICLYPFISCYILLRILRKGCLRVGIREHTDTRHEP